MEFGLTLLCRLCRTRLQLARSLLTVVLVTCATTLVILHVHLQLLPPQLNEATSPVDEALYSRRAVGGTVQQTGQLQPIVKTRLWPSPTGETSDRILNQLQFISNLDRPNDKGHHHGTKQILVYNGYPEGVLGGELQMLQDQCPVRACVLTDNRNEADKADVILFQGIILKPQLPRPPGQIWVLYLLESPTYTQNFNDFSDSVNWTATYRTDSTIVTPYEKFVPFARNNTTNFPYSTASVPIATKTKLVAWFVSNCGTNNGRYEYAKQLSKHIEVDIYGECGPLRCPRGDSEGCFRMLRNQYKFYLAFENSNCKHYITEKFFRNALLNDVVPIVMGARAADYRAVAPPHSFIHVDDFSSPRDLAAYLHELDRNSTRYNEYFRWKGTGHFIDTKFWCRLCAMLHHVGDHVTSYSQLNEWWNKRGTCVNRKRGRGWARWKPVSTLINK